MGISGSERRVLRLAPYLALLMVVTGLVWVAVRADGYQAHDPELHDGGIWVTNSTAGFYGRVNKPIGQLDSALFARTDSTLDVVQDGAAVLGVDTTGSSLSVIDPAQVKVPTGSTASIVANGQVQLAGGTLGVLDPAEGTVWGQRVDAVVGLPPVGGVDQSAEPLTVIGGDAALAVTGAGTVLAVSAETDELVRISAVGAAFGEETREQLTTPVTRGAAITAVGETAVVLDRESGTLSVPGSSVSTQVDPAAVLQQPGPAADAVLVAEGTRLLSVDLTSGTAATVLDVAGGTPAAPVRLGPCVFGAWAGGAGEVVTACGQDDPRLVTLGEATRELVFRVNRGEIVLNDLMTGGVWDIDNDQPTKLDQWDTFQRKVVDSEEDDQQQEETQSDNRPPRAEPDAFGARPGRTTVLHPLDNDTAPEGRLLSIAEVTDVQPAGAEVTVSPDGQTVQIRMPAQATVTTFTYFIDDGRDLSDDATVTVTPRGPAENAPPTLRPGFEPRTWSVPVGGVLDVPVLPDWRDPGDGDPLVVASASAVNGERNGAQARVTGSGRIRFEAPSRPGPVEIEYAVSDNVGEPVPVVFAVNVQGGREAAVPAVAEPDVASGEVGEPIVIRPLANDLPGSDPVVPDAKLVLASKVAPADGADVQTDLVDGTVTLRASTPKTYVLDYEVAYGNAPFAHGRVRVDVRPPQNPPRGPVAMPDTLTIYGQDAAMVDALANDLDPGGRLLVVQRAEGVEADQLDVAVVDGRWVRVSARQALIGPNPQVVRYTISNGGQQAQGEIVVSQKPRPEDEQPVTEVDRVQVRAGSAVAVAALDNDFSPTGAPLRLVDDLVDADAGQLVVQPPGDAQVSLGRAYVSGRFVRYVAPADLTDATTFTIPYEVEDTRGQRAAGRVEVTVLPAEDNRAPRPPALEARVVAGGSVTLRLPGSGVDPDGDPVTLTGVVTAPTLGRVLRFGADALVYEAFPDSTGTEEFQYQVTDQAGGVATGVVRVGIVAPTVPQPPLAVPDTASVAPGRTMLVDVLANDHIAADDRVEVELVNPPPGVEQVSHGLISIPAPQTADGTNVEAVYRLDNGVDSSQSTVTLRVVEPYDNPPVVPDAYGRDAAGGTGGADSGQVTVDVLAEAYDPDGPKDQLRVTEVSTPPGVAPAEVDGSTITVARGATPLVIPFRVEDADGGAATASLYVPPAASALPHIAADALIELDPGERQELALDDYVVNPSGGPVSFTLRDQIWGAPAGVTAAIVDDTTFEVTAGEGYAGPGAVSFEVTTGQGVDDPTGVRTILTVPVQVGETKPVLRCPADAVQIAQGQLVELDITSICHVWTMDPADADELTYNADWETSSPGLNIIEPSGATISVAAEANAQEGSTGLLTVTAGDSDPGRIPFEVIAVPPPTMTPVVIDDMRAGEERAIDLAPYLRPGVEDPSPRIVAADQLTTLDLGVGSDGSRLVLSAGDEVSGRAEIRVVMTDVDGDPPPSRQAETRISLQILDVPDAPTTPVPGRTPRSEEVVLSWEAPEANGSPITRYEVRDSRGGVHTCAGATCTVGGLTNGVEYTFEVRAHNAVGPSEWSAPSAPVTPDAIPGLVGPVQLDTVGDGTMTISWSPPTTRTSKIVQYLVSYPGGATLTTTSTSITIPGLDNNKTYVFTVAAQNALDVGPGRASRPLQSIGTPGTPAAPTVTEHESNTDHGGVTVTWQPVVANGPDPVTYTVLRNGVRLSQCTDIEKTSCDDTGIYFDGTRYDYSVVATNTAVPAPGGQARSAEGPATSWFAVGRPGNWEPITVRPTGNDQEARVEFNAPAANGKEPVISYFIDGAGSRSGTLPYRGGWQEHVIQMPDNDRGHTIRLTLCNESDKCSTSQTKEVQTYGPLRPEHILSIDSEIVDETRVRWTITVDANGAPATVSVNSNRRTREPFEIGNVNTTTITTTAVEVGYGNTETITVTLADSGRGSAQKTAARQVPEPPPATVVVERGRPCNDDNPAQRCNTTAQPSDDCSAESCGFVRLTLGNWRQAATCTLSGNGGTGDLSGQFELGNGPHDLRAYWGGGGTVTAECRWGRILGGGQSASGSVEWPQ